MILTTHAVIGAALFVSHFVLDAISHVDYPIKSRSVNPKIAAPWYWTGRFFRTL
jgi:hypothetical protein